MLIINLASQKRLEHSRWRCLLESHSLTYRKVSVAREMTELLWYFSM